MIRQTGPRGVAGSCSTSRTPTSPARRCSSSTSNASTTWGILTNRRDFNGDGVVNATDLSNFNAQWNAYNGKTTGCNWIHGDVDQDNDVDLQDKLSYTAWYHVFGNPPPVLINLGAAEPDDVFTMPD
jgi:curved DNA-binding protein CbpA